MSDDSIFSGLKEQAADYAKTLGRKAIKSAGDKVDKLSDRFDGSSDSAGAAAQAGAEEIAEGKSPAKAALSAATAGAKDKIKGVFGGGSSGSSGGSGDFKFSNIIETADVGVPLSVAYNAFTMFENWPDFMKKVENVERTDDVKISVKGQAVWSHRTWEATIIEQVPDSHIVWESTGEKGYISGSVSFHELAPRLTRIIASGEYHKQGFVEGVGALWFTVPRRFRLELKFFVHHVMNEIMIDQDGVEGWRGEIRDSELVISHEDALEEEQAQAEADEADEQEYEDAAPYEEDEEPREYGESEDETDPVEGEDAEGEYVDEPVDEEPEEEYVDEPAEEEPVEEGEPVEEEEIDDAGEPVEYEEDEPEEYEEAAEDESGRN
ncbi:SRPBCC family protein [Brevibacterium sp. UCMA 11754]|uniref:SRPBCC family protein n=1 Tax=Brevibacterium sp. UCMA 11754 TaxID=2749198 RepID=UPI001F33302E|nr:SRPBCC family protein [Brevibacterium sp. UCMA 11754]MCF2573836.1 cyclase [Brevibacterium sp. UCMA 11754]